MERELTSELETALLVYLGGPADSPAIELLDGRDRLRAKYDLRADEMFVACRQFLGGVGDNNELLKAADLLAIGNKAEEWMAQHHPTTSQVLRQKIGNFVAYQWK